MSRYHLFLLFSVLFIFLSTTLYLALIRDLADSPMKVCLRQAPGSESLYPSQLYCVSMNVFRDC